MSSSSVERFTDTYLVSLSVQPLVAGTFCFPAVLALAYSMISRDQLLRAGVHGQLQAGISGDSSENGGAFSICVSGGYEDNRDNGEKMYVNLFASISMRPHHGAQHLRRVRYDFHNGFRPCLNEKYQVDRMQMAYASFLWSYWAQLTPSQVQTANQSFEHPYNKSLLVSSP